MSQEQSECRHKRAKYNMGNLLSDETNETEDVEIENTTVFPSSEPGCAENSVNNANVPSKFSVFNGPMKMVLCVNMSLNMGKGKIAAQCCHASLGAYKMSVKKNKLATQYWEYTGAAKVALKVDSNEQLSEIQSKATAAGLVTYLVQDAGKTQIAFGSRTVLAIGPAPNNDFEGITSDLKLL